MIYVIGPKDKTPNGVVVINTTSKVKSIFSPFYNKTTSPIKSKIMENAWQYSKVYAHHETDGKPNREWLEWSDSGFRSKWANRYPMGKGSIPLYSWFNGQKLDYIEARKQLYVPLYKNSVNTPAHKNEMDLILNSLYKYDDIALWDYDGYLTNDNFDTIINNPEKKMGHAFVLREILYERMKEINYDREN